MIISRYQGYYNVDNNQYYINIINKCCIGSNNLSRRIVLTIMKAIVITRLVQQLPVKIFKISMN